MLPLENDCESVPAIRNCQITYALAGYSDYKYGSSVVASADFTMRELNARESADEETTAAPAVANTKRDTRTGRRVLVVHELERRWRREEAAGTPRRARAPRVRHPGGAPTAYVAVGLTQLGIAA